VNTHVPELQQTSEPPRPEGPARRARGPDPGPVASIMRVQGLVGNRSTSRAMGAGAPLPPPIRSEMEERFDADFGSVRVHSGAGAERFLRESNAEAATIGESIALPSAAVPSQPGRRLIAHELAHVLQQRRGGSHPSPLAGSSLECEAERAAGAFDSPARGAIEVAGASGVGIARQAVASARGRDPAAMSVEELQREIG
jgi:hypothetical protein